MQEAGYEVDLWGGGVTVSYYRHLAEQKYSLVFIRSHSGGILNRTRDLESSYGTYVFTNVQYNALKYTTERINNEILHAATGEGQPQLFAVGAEFFKTVSAGRFEGTVVILDGCHGCIMKTWPGFHRKRGGPTWLECLGEAGIRRCGGRQPDENLLVKRLPVSQAVGAAMWKTGRTGDRPWLKYSRRSAEV
jgi:hypothetical protein